MSVHKQRMEQAGVGGPLLRRTGRASLAGGSNDSIGADMGSGPVSGLPTGTKPLARRKSRNSIFYPSQNPDDYGQSKTKDK